MRGRTRMLVLICCAMVVIVGAALAVSLRGDQGSKVLPKASCGSAVTHRLDTSTTIITAQPGALACFNTAARSCGPASIQLVEMGVDTGTTYVFRIEPGGAACQAVESSQDYSANFGGSTSQVSSLTCSKITATTKGVTLTCGGQDVLIPATSSSGLQTGA